MTDTFLSSSCLLWGWAAALTSASDALFGCPMARPIRPTLWTALKKQHVVHMSVNTVKILQQPLQETSKLATGFFFTWEKHLFKLSIVVKPTTRSSATPQSYTDRKQRAYYGETALRTVIRRWSFRPLLCLIFFGWKLKSDLSEVFHYKKKFREASEYRRN